MARHLPVLTVMRTHTRGFVSAAARLVVPLAALGAMAAGCRPVPGSRHAVSPMTSGGTVITEADITNMGARTAWDVVRMRAPRLVAGQDAQGRPAGVRIQESHSIYADETPLLVVDGAQVDDISYLTEISASELHLVRILDGEVATQLYGIKGAGGAIVVETKHGS